ncbi:MAG: dihydrolipoamide acetyltransferase family protein [Spirochaetaceae bacterium]|nr:dihydrolipoamide acetyltransferase family protein [Spirochaetaceae bacterium]
MAQELVMPKLGNTVETVVIIEWRKNVGDSVDVGEAICEVETDKATVEVEAETAGTLLARLYETDDEVPVLVPFALVGDAGEDVSDLAGNKTSTPKSQEAPSSSATPAAPAAPEPASPAPAAPAAGGAAPGISPRARNLAAASGLNGLPAAGTGPGGRIIERDVQAALEGRTPLTPAARAVGGSAPHVGSGIGGRVTAADMAAAPAASAASAARRASFPADFPGPCETVPVKGIRQIIAQRMHASLQDTAQLTLNASANAASLLSWRSTYKESPEEFGLNKVSMNDLVMFAAARLLKRHPELNATLTGGEIKRYGHVHMGFAVDTPKGLMVPVVRFADTLSLSQLSEETRRLAAACRDGKAGPDDLSGGTFTITNLGAFGIENFTPVLNAPEVGILGVGTIVNAPIETPDGIGIEKRVGLSLTIDHQAVDGAPGARFLKDLSALLANLEWAAAL